jgi:hypothetical protein
MPVAISIHFLNVAILEAARSAALAARVFALDAASVVGDRPPSCRKPRRAKQRKANRYPFHHVSVPFLHQC